MVTLIGLFSIAAICGLLVLIAKPTGPATSYLERVYASLISLIGSIAWAALAAAVIVSVLNFFRADQIPETIDGINAAMADANGLLGKSWMIFLPLCVLILSASLWLNIRATQPGAVILAQTMKWAGITKGLAALLVTTTLVGAEANSTETVWKNSLRAALANIEHAQLALYHDAQIVLINEAVSAGLAEIELEHQQAADIVASYNSVAALLSPALARGQVENSDLLERLNTTEFRVDRGATATEAELRNLEVKISLSARAAQDKLVADIVRLGFAQSGADDIKDAFIDLGNPVLNMIRDAFLDPATTEPLQNYIALQASRFLHKEIDFKTAVVETRDWTRAKVRAFTAAAGHLGTGKPSGFGMPEWNVVRERIASIVESGIRKKFVNSQDEAWRAVRRTQAAQADIARLTWASPQRANLEEAAFARYMTKRDLAYAVLWGPGVIAGAPVHFQSDIDALSVDSNEDRARNIMRLLFLSKVNLEAAKMVRNMGFDPEADTILILKEFQKKLYANHELHLTDGYALYFTALSGHFKEAREYYLDLIWSIDSARAGDNGTPGTHRGSPNSQRLALPKISPPRIPRIRRAR